MTESVLVERVGDYLLLTQEGYEDDYSKPEPRYYGGNDEQLHSDLCRLGYLRVGPAKDDQIAGLYMRRAA